MLKRSEIEHIDKSGMFETTKALPEQVRGALKVAKNIDFDINPLRFNNIIISGMGGSAIGGDLVKSYLRDKVSIPIMVNRSYTLPAYANDKTLLILSSYSGSTEEILSVMEEGERRKCNLIAVTTGGKLGHWAGMNSKPVVSLPKGYQPRAALAFSFVPLLFILSKFYPSNKIVEEIETASRFLESSSENLTSLDDSNPALTLAEKLVDRLSIIYASADLYDAVATRWKGQFSENSKVLAYTNLFPELNHNEIVGWEKHEKLLKSFHIICLRDTADHPRVRCRFDVTIEMIEEFAAGVTEVAAKGSSLLQKILYLIYFGDMVSLYLAFLNGVDPTPVERIDKLKNELEKL